jgi:hypothetical protein
MPPSAVVFLIRYAAMSRSHKGRCIGLPNDVCELPQNRGEREDEGYAEQRKIDGRGQSARLKVFVDVVSHFVFSFSA